MLRYFNAIIESFYSKDLYRQVGQEWKLAAASMFMLLVSFLSWLPGIYNNYGISITLASVFNEDTNYRGMLAQLPQMVVTNGSLGIDRESPLAVRDPASKQPLIIFDTHNQLTDITAFPHGVIVHEKKAQVKFKDGTVKEYLLPQNGSLDAATLVKLYDMRWMWFGFVIFPGLVFLSWVARFFYSVVLGIFTLIFARMAHAELSYKQAITVTIVAMTPALVLSTLLEAMNFQHPVLIATYVVLTLGYMVFGVISNK